MLRPCLFTLSGFIFSFAFAQMSADFGGASGGAIRVGDSITTCTSLIQGAVKYDVSARTLKYCDSSTWKVLVADACATSLPTDWTFTPLTGQTRSTLVTSSIHQMTGLGSCVVPISVTGIGSTAEYRICSDAACATVTQNWGSTLGSITNNLYVQLRLTTSAYGNVTHQGNLTVGNRVENWTATTTGDCSVGSPPIGTLCADGTFYVGITPDGSTKMYTTPCNPGRIWDGTACTGNQRIIPWSSLASIATGVINATTGEANTAAIAVLSNADSPYPAAQYCYNYNGYGQSDWYLPSTNDIPIIVAACDLMPEAPCSDSTSRYWTSSELTASNAFFFTFSSSSAAGGGKASVSNVVRARCVRKD